ncbi:flagellar motor switch protein FliM [Alicyclobacillus hesperidum URH17-3-68]|nr:flagellar motor switch protein FliM [Alicyclobacillus hesperidum URH17-3-68]
MNVFDGCVSGVASVQVFEVYPLDGRVFVQDDRIDEQVVFICVV